MVQIGLFVQCQFKVNMKPLSVSCKKVLLFWSQEKNKLTQLPAEEFAIHEQKLWDSRNFYVRVRHVSTLKKRGSCELVRYLSCLFLQNFLLFFVLEYPRNIVCFEYLLCLGILVITGCCAHLNRLPKIVYVHNLKKLGTLSTSLTAYFVL